MGVTIAAMAVRCSTFARIFVVVGAAGALSLPVNMQAREGDMAAASTATVTIRVSVQETITAQRRAKSAARPAQVCFQPRTRLGYFGASRMSGRSDPIPVQVSKRRKCWSAMTGVSETNRKSNASGAQAVTTLILAPA